MIAIVFYLKKWLRSSTFDVAVEGNSFTLEN